MSQTEDRSNCRPSTSSSRNEKPGYELSRSQRCMKWLRRCRQLWIQKTGIDWATYKMLFKGALSPTIALACSQTDAWPKLFGPVGYLVTLGTLCSLSFYPRGQFIQILLLNLIATCLGAAVTGLTFYCMVKARAQQGKDVYGYDSSESAVAGVWIVTQTFIISGLRFLDFLMIWPCSIGLIYSNFGIDAALQIGDMTVIMNSLQQIFLALMTGLAISTGVCIFVFPSTNRSEYFQSVVACSEAIKSALHANRRQLHHLEKSNSSHSEQGDKGRGLAGLQARLTGSLGAAEQEFAIGRLKHGDLHDLNDRLAAVITPLVSLGRLSEEIATVVKQKEEQFGAQEVSIQPSEDYARLLQTFQEPLANITVVAAHGMDHAMIMLDLKKATKHFQDEEMRLGSNPEPGAANFASQMHGHVERIWQDRITALSAWYKLHDIQDTPDNTSFIQPSRSAEATPSKEAQCTRSNHNKQHLDLLLYTEFLMWSVSRRVLELVLFADDLKASGKLQKRRLILPHFERYGSWFFRPFTTGYTTNSTEPSEDFDWTQELELGQGFSRRRHPTHLPPTTRWEYSSESFRQTWAWFGTANAGFALRVTFATMTIAVVALLKNTQSWFQAQHAAWAQFTVAFAMCNTTGLHFRGFLFRVLATVFAVLFSWVSWYAVDHVPAGVIVFYWMFMHLPMYIMIKQPRFFQVGIIYAFAFSTILANELQAKKSNLTIYPIYTFGAIRLAAITVGMFTGYLWTILPFPISQRDSIRKTLASALYSLANLHAITCVSVGARLLGERQKVSTDYRKHYQKTQSRIRTKCMLRLQGLRAQLRLVKYDIPVGGRFPRNSYEKAAASIDSLLSSLQLIDFASLVFAEFIYAEFQPHRLQKLQKRYRKSIRANEDAAAVLVLLSNALSTKSALPPHLQIPQKQWFSVDDSSFPSLEKVVEPGHATLTVMQIGIDSVHERLEELLAGVKELVGELDFSYRWRDDSLSADVLPIMHPS